MEFDHVDGRKGKRETVSALVGSGTLQRLMAEINKCDIVCANCHAKRTHIRAVEAGLRTDGI